MSVNARIRELIERHKRLEKSLHAARQQPASNDEQLATLKRQKLRIKDEIASLKAS